MSESILFLFIIGMFTFPIFTFGCLLCYFDYNLIGGIVIIYSLLKDDN